MSLNEQCTNLQYLDLTITSATVSKPTLSRFTLSSYSPALTVGVQRWCEIADDVAVISYQWHHLL